MADSICDGSCLTVQDKKELTFKCEKCGVTSVHQYYTCDNCGYWWY